MLSDVEQLLQIDEEVAALQASIRELYNKRNRFVPISRLPPEIISRVFLCLRDHVNSASNPLAPILRSHEQHIQKLSWTVTMHVCRQWRDIALGCPELWNNIDLSLPFPWVEAFLERSRATPLTAIIPASLRDRLAKIALRILGQPHRLQALSLTAYSPSPGSKSMELVTSLSGVSAPLIRSITLNFQSAYGHISTASPILPREFCNGGTPLLRYLDLKHCRIPWTSPLFDNLTSFSMNTGSFGSYDYAQGSLADFFDALERMSKGLEELDLCVDLPETTSFNGHSTIAFPKLTKLKLKTRLQDCITILNHLLLPISTSLELAVPGPPSENVPAAKAAGSELAAGIDTAWLATPLITTSSLAPNPKLSIRVLEISATQIAGGTKARFWIHGLDIARRPIRLTKGKRRTLTPLPPASLTLTTSPSSLILIAALPIQNLQSIDIRAPINKWMWDELAGLPSLQSIALNGETGPSFLNYVCKDPAMTSRPPQPDAKATSTKHYQSKVEKTPKSKIRRSRSAYLFGKLILKKAAEANIISAGSLARPLTKPSYFPNLTHLSFTEVDFGLDQYLDPDDGMAINWDKFIDFLLFRRDSPKPINSIRALMCVNLMRPDVASIKAAVPRVEWDGLEEQRYAYDFRGIWSNGHDSEECEGQCHYHRGRHLNHGPSFGVPHTPLATGFGFNF